MKNSKKPLKAIILFIAFIAGGCAASQNPVRVEKMRTLVESKNFIFRPNAILPLPSTAQRLDLATGRFFVTLNNGNLSAELPYIGESISPAIGRDEVNIKFNTTNFTYDQKNTKKNRWQITVRPQGVQNVNEMIFDIYDNGTATVKVGSNTRQSISFEGYIVTE